MEIAGVRSTWQLGHEADLERRVLSLEAPLAGALLTALPDEPFSFKGPRGVVEGRLLGVEHPDGPDGLERVLHSLRLMRHIQAKVAARKVLSLGEKDYLTGLAEHGLLAEALENEFALTRDTLAAAMASSAWRKAGQPLKALRATEGVEDPHPTRMAMLLTTRGAALLDIGDLEGAEQWARRAMELAPSSHYPRNLLGRVLMQRGQVKEALRAFEEAQKFAPSQALEADVLEQGGVGEL